MFARHKHNGVWCKQCKRANGGRRSAYKGRVPAARVPPLKPFQGESRACQSLVVPQANQQQYSAVSKQPLSSHKRKYVSAADEQPPVFAVFSSKGHAELDAGCSVAVHPPLQMLTLPCGRRVVLCANVEQA